MDSTIKLWNVEEGLLIKTIEGHSDYVLAVCFSGDDHLGTMFSIGKYIFHKKV